MTSRTVVESVERVSGPPDNLDALERELEQLRQRYPQAIFARYLGATPQIATDAYVAPGASIVGRVQIAAQCSIWFGCVLRGDVNRIEIGARSNLQDGTVVHLGDVDPTIVGEDVVVGHRVVLHGCTIGAKCLVGIGATLLDGVRVGEGSIIGAGALVPAGTEVPPNSLVLGLPAKVVRSLDPAAGEMHRALAAKYTRLAHNYLHG